MDTYQQKTQRMQSAVLRRHRPRRTPLSWAETRRATWIDPEERAYPNGGFTRRGRVVLRSNAHNPVVLPYGELRMVRLSIPDTYFTVPARFRYQSKTIKGFVSVESEGGAEPFYTFTPEADPEHCTNCEAGDGCKYQPQGSF